MKDNNLKKLHSIETEILKRFVRLCDDNSITYYIIGGTLIGAVRHGGFIPWDDDIDIAVPRSDYYKLINVMHKCKDDILGMEYYKDDESLYFYPIKIVDKTSYIYEPRRKDGKAHPWIDILPLDGAPTGEISARIFKFRMLYYKLMLGIHYADNLRDIKRSSLEKMVIKFAKVTHVGRFINPTRIKDKLDILLASHSVEKSKIVGTCMGAYFFHEFVPKKYFGNGSRVTFEGLDVNAPEQVEKYLTHMYGDYMKLPPVEKQVAHDVQFL